METDPDWTTRIERARIYQPQLNEFTLETIRAVPTTTPVTADRLSQAAVAVDIGGDKVVATLYESKDGLIGPTKELFRCIARDGRGYLDALADVALEARGRNLPVGISFAGPVRDGRALAGLNLPVFMAEFKRTYDLEFRNIFDWSTTLNDGEAGVVAASRLAEHVFGSVSNVVLIINGSGLNAAAALGQQIYTTEAGHVKVLDCLNRFGQQKICPMSSPPHVCVEHVAASRAGIEDIWRQKTGEITTGHEIAKAMRQGDQLAIELYGESAFVTAHLVRGVFDAFDIADEWSNSVIVCHGGTFNVPGFADHVATILMDAFGAEAKLMCAADFSTNICLDGAAYAALALERP